MIADDGFDQDLRAWLQAEAGVTSRPELHAEAMSIAGRTHPRPRWLATVVAGRARPPIAAPGRAVWVAVGLALVLLAAGVAVVGSPLLRERTPASRSLLFVEQAPTQAGIHASTVDLGTGEQIATWDLALPSGTSSGAPGSIERAVRWSPDRRHVLVESSDGRIVMADLSSGAITSETIDPLGPIGASSWAPGSDRIAHLDPAAGDAILVEDVDLHVLMRLQLPDGATPDSSPAWSPLGSTIAITGCTWPCTDASMERLYLVPIDRAPTIVLDTGGATPPLTVDTPVIVKLRQLVWSPDRGPRSPSRPTKGSRRSMSPTGA